MVGPLKAAPEGFTHLFVIDDKFTKWIEVKRVATITMERAAEFFWDIIFWFDVPNIIITDNSTQFTGEPFLQFYEYYDIILNFAVVAHPCTNRLFE